MKKRKSEPLPLLQTGVGTILTSMIVSGFLLGYLTDALFGTIPLFLLLFGLLGIVGGIMKVHELLIKAPINKKVDERAKRTRE